MFQGSIGDKFCCVEFKPCIGRFIGGFKPVFDGFTLIREAIFSNDRINHQCPGNWAVPLIGIVFVLILLHK
jgi:hypothetical protein